MLLERRVEGDKARQGDILPNIAAKENGFLPKAMWQHRRRVGEQVPPQKKSVGATVPVARATQSPTGRCGVSPQRG